MKKFNTTVCMVATLFAVMFSFQFATAQQTNSVNKFPTAATNAQTVPAGKTWVNPQNVISLNNGTATVSLAKNGICTATKCYRSAYLQADHFGFNLTTDDSVVGIVATVRLKASASNSIKEMSVQIADWSNVVGVPVNKASNTFWPTQYQLRNFGGQNDTWGIVCCIGTWGLSNDFGLKISIQNLNAATAPKATIDYISMTIYYITNGARIENQTREAGNISDAWQIYPNPVVDVLQLKSLSDVSSALVKVFNMQGQLVLEKNIGALNENETTEIETASLAKGIYLLQLITERGIDTKRFVKE